MTPVIFGAAWGLFVPWAIVAVRHGHVRLNRGCQFTRAWLDVAVFGGVTALVIAAIVTVAAPLFTGYCLALACGYGGSAVLAWLAGWWQRRRKSRALAALGYKAAALIADLVRSLRDAARPRPVFAPGGAR